MPRARRTVEDRHETRPRLHRWSIQLSRTHPSTSTHLSTRPFVHLGRVPVASPRPRRVAPAVPTDPLVTSRRASPRARDATARDATETPPRRNRSSARRRTRANARRERDARRDRVVFVPRARRRHETKRRHVDEIGRRQGEFGKSGEPNDAVRDDVGVAVLVVREDDGRRRRWAEETMREKRARETRMNE